MPTRARRISNHRWRRTSRIAVLGGSSLAANDWIGDSEKGD